MKFTVNRATFLKKLKDVQLAVSSRATIPILTGIKLMADSEGIKMTGSNSDISIETLLTVSDESADLSIDTPGQMVLQPARFFSDIVNKLPDEKFTVEVTNGVQTSITSASSAFVINGLDAVNYPRLPEIDTKDAFTLPVNLLKKIIKQTVIAVSTHESRPILQEYTLLLKKEN